MTYFRNEQLSPAEATARIRKIARIGSTGTSKHCRKRMVERNFLQSDLLALLQNGEVKEPAEWHDRTQCYRYKVEGQTADDDAAVAITVIVDHRSIIVVTIF